MGPPNLLPEGLNRTSVGLKPRGGKSNMLAFWAPQSNQRGIETNASSTGMLEVRMASIEPAWD